MKSPNNLIVSIIIFVSLIISFSCKSPFGGGQSGDPKAAVQKAYEKFMEARFYHSVVKTKDAQNEVETELDFVAPDRFSIKNQMPNMKTEVIAIGNEAYNRINDGKWIKLPDGQIPVSELRKQMSKDAVNAMKDFESLGTESLNGTDAAVYKFKSSAGGETISKMWVSPANGLPLRVETEGNFGGKNIQLTITYNYDKEIKIEAPSVN